MVFKVILFQLSYKILLPIYTFVVKEIVYEQITLTVRYVKKSHIHEEYNEMM